MSPFRVLRVSLESLSAHKLRTALTMLGIIFGVGAVIAMLSIGEGAKREALEQISILGVRNIILRAKVPDESGSSDTGLARSPGLSLEDAANIERFAPTVTNVVPQRFEQVATVMAGSEKAQVRVVATVPRYIISSSIDVEKGRFIHPIDEETFAQVCVLGAKAKRGLFAFSDPIGKTVRIGDLDFAVVGVMTDKYIGRGKVEGFELVNLNDDIYIPFATAVKKLARGTTPAASFVSRFGGSESTAELQRYNTPEIDQVTVTVRDLEDVAPVSALIERVLRRRHFGVDDYEIVVPESLLRQTLKTQRIFNIVMGAIAGISLLVGGIGIMNIMLATVLERTREIGVRRAVGATRAHILMQFLTEAVAICLVGCLIGVVFGLTMARVIAHYAGWPTIVSIASIALSIGVSTAVGLSFGIYPARRAASMNVIDALRYE